MVAPIASNGYSARVRLELRVGETRLPLAQIGQDRIILVQPAILPGTAGEVFAFIDDHVQRWSIEWAASETPRRIIPTELRPAKKQLVG
ncbi:MAG: hypothetical protein FWD53_06200 [Phycisphaerales bacterium]|nr:hypothetical protein [Phycisphaerales bacterium]